MKRLLLGLVALLVAVPVVVVLGSGLVLDSAAVRQRVSAAVERATGRGFRIDGPIGIAWSLVPAIEVRRAVLLNLPGFSREALATVRRVEVRLALLPLLSGRVEVRSVVIEGPDVLLERDAAGRGNWQAPVAPVVAGPAGPVAAPAARTPVEVSRVTVEDGRVALLGVAAVVVPALSVSPAGGAVAGTVQVNGVAFEIKGRTGALDRAPVAVEVSAVGGGVAASVAGEMGGALTVQVLAPALEAVSGLAGRALPALRDVQVTGQMGPGGVSGMRLVAGTSEVAPGVRLVRLSVDAPALDKPVQVAAEGMVRALPVAVALNAGSLAAVLAGGMVPVQVLVVADGATVAGQGSVADLSGRGLEMTVSARVPDLRRTGGLAGVALPPVRDGALDVRVLPGPGGTVLARGLRLSMAQGDVAGDLAFGVGARASVRGSLVSQRLDLDGLAMPVAAAPVAPAPGPVGPAPQSVAPGQSFSGRLIPERAVPFEVLRGGDADVRLQAGAVVLGGAEYRAIEARVLLQDGRLRVDPMQMVSPGGAVQGQVMADASAAPPTVAVTLRGRGLDAGPIAAALGGGGALTGAVDVDVQLRAAGADVRALAATLEGRLGVALVDGEVDNQALAGLFGPALRAAGLPVELGGRSHVRCLAARFDVAGGQAAMKALALDATRVRLEGEGTFNLVDETMDARLKPTIRIGSAGVQTPVRLTGPWRAPVPALERNLAGRFGLSIGVAANDPCGPGLAAARDGRAGAMPR